jgi:Gpi18-like mannosyltransferase
MRECWLPWMRATRGLFPWRAYSIPNCNYPPFMLYIWTAAEALERLAHLHHHPRFLFAILLVKLPNLLAYTAGSLLCLHGLKPVLGLAAARSIAIAYTLCLPLWFNAAIWGQCDAMLCLALLAALIALLNDRPLLAAATVGWALSIKLQAIVILPAAVVYTLRRFGLPTTLKSALTALSLLALILLPMVLAGYTRQTRLSYSGAVGLYPFLSIDTFNPWSLVTLFNLFIRHLPPALATSDAQLWFHLITPRQIGLLAFSAYTLWLMLHLYRSPTRYNAALTAGLTAYSFFMLSTQMHERYIIPAAALLTLCTTHPTGRRLYLAIMIPAMLNQLKGMAAQLLFPHSDPATIQHLMNRITLSLSTLNLLLFLWITQTAHHHLTTPHSQ